MNYLSTRDKSLKFSFKDIFLRGLAPGGGLFLPSEIRSYDKTDLENLSKLSYPELATEILYNFCSDNLTKGELSSLVKDAYKHFEDKEVVKIKKIGNINLLELYHGPTLAFKDIAMQVIGNMYDQLKVAEKKSVNVVVATSGDTGSAAIAALNDRKNINLFVLHPHNKISNIQRKIMTTIGSRNIFNIAIEGSFDDCQKIVKELFNENDFREKINMSGVNSINWARIICQIVYYFYAYFFLGKEKISFSVPTGNFGDAYAGYIAKKKFKIPINKLIPDEIKEANNYRSLKDHNWIGYYEHLVNNPVNFSKYLIDNLFKDIDYRIIGFCPAKATVKTHEAMAGLWMKEMNAIVIMHNGQEKGIRFPRNIPESDGDFDTLIRRWRLPTSSEDYVVFRTVAEKFPNHHIIMTGNMTIGRSYTIQTKGFRFTDAMFPLYFQSENINKIIQI